MLLALNVNNTNTLLALFRTAPGPVELLAHWRISTQRTQTADEYGMLVRNLLASESLRMDEIEHVIIASVVPPLDTTLRQFCQRYIRHKAIFVEPGVKTGMPILTDNPSEVGADRVANGVGAFAKYGGPCIVVDFGTATNFDVISARGEFLGGAIAPGLNISAEALFARAARLPRVDIRKPAKVIGTNTVDNLQIGLFYGHIALVDGILARMIAELGAETKCIGTGGLAHVLAGESKYITAVDDMLTLDGLRIIFERHNERAQDRAPEKTRATKSSK
jgi:type III pantothenate kinase